MGFQAVYRRHTPFALELFTYPLFNGSFRVQKVGDVLLYAYLFSEQPEFNWRGIESVSFYIGGQEIDTWDSFYLNTLHPVLTSQYAGYAPDDMPHFLPLPLPMLPTKNMKYHEIEIVVRPPLKVSLNIMFAFVNEDIPDSDILYQRVFKQTVQPNVPFSLYGAVKYITSSNLALDTIRIDRDYTIAPLNVQFMFHSRTKTFQYVGRNVIEFDIGIRTLYAEADENTLNMYGYDSNDDFIFTRMDYYTQNRIETRNFGALQALKVVNGKYIVTLQNVYDTNLTTVYNSPDEIVECFLINQTLFVILRKFGIYNSNSQTIIPYAFSDIEYFSAQVKDNFIIVYSKTEHIMFYDVVNNFMSAQAPNTDISSYVISSSIQRDPLDTFEGNSKNLYTRENEYGQTVIYRKNDPIFTIPGNGYRQIIYDSQNIYVYFLSLATSTIFKLQEALYDTYRIPMIIPFCLDTNSTGLSGYRWFNGEDIRLNGSGTLYAITYNILTVKNGMASLRF